MFHDVVTGMRRSAQPSVSLVTLLVDDYHAAIAFFVDVLGFAVANDSSSLTDAGRPKRWVVVRPPGAGTGRLLAEADGARPERSRRQPDGRASRLLPDR